MSSEDFEIEANPVGRWLKENSFDRATIVRLVDRFDVSSLEKLAIMDRETLKKFDFPLGIEAKLWKQITFLKLSWLKECTLDDVCAWISRFIDPSLTTPVVSESRTSPGGKSPLDELLFLIKKHQIDGESIALLSKEDFIRIGQGNSVIKFHIDKIWELLQGFPFRFLRIPNSDGVSHELVDNRNNVIPKPLPKLGLLASFRVPSSSPKPEPSDQSADKLSGRQCLTARNSESPTTELFATVASSHSVISGGASWFSTRSKSNTGSSAIRALSSSEKHRSLERIRATKPQPESSKENESSTPRVPPKVIFLPGDIALTNLTLKDDHTNPYDVKTALFTRLVFRLCFPIISDVSVYKRFRKVFFTTYRPYSKPVELFKMLETHYHNLESDEEEWAKTYDNVQSYHQKKKETVCWVFLFWLSKHYADYSFDDLLRDLIRKFADANIKPLSSPKPPKHLKLQEFVDKKIGAYVSLFGEIALEGEKQPQPPNLPPNLDNVSWMDLNEEELARQITMNEYHIYLDIQPAEFHGLAWSKKHAELNAPNVKMLITKFNELSKIVASAIISSPKIKSRTKVTEKFLRIGEFLLGMNNYNALMAILSGMNNSAIHRLKYTFGQIGKKYAKTLTDIQQLLSSEGSYKNLRHHLESVTPPCIPFIGVYLTDLTFVEEGNQDQIDGLVNFRKKALEYDVISQILKFQNCRRDVFNFQMVPRVVDMIYSLPQMTDSQLYDLSLIIEPRNAKKKDLQ